ncbi:MULTISPECIES: hypothetical protein [Streptomyces]|uniref:hypothetical protein n=1 Tax=Streptomyces TaxID=1883 RepID=UPI0005BE80DA|nr:MULTISPECIES: hypothetical protein [Streptomyces]MDP9949083.1 hypothetical protein [Streptomyces sp. DSM 41269]
MKLPKDLVKPFIVIAALGVAIPITTTAIGVEWIKTAGVMVILGTGMLWGAVLRERRIRESQDPGALPGPGPSDSEQDAQS